MTASQVGKGMENDLFLSSVTVFWCDALQIKEL